MDDKKMVLKNKNYILIVVGCIVVLLGFLLMSGGGAEGSEFNPEIFSSRRIVFAPLIIIIAFIMSGIAIMIKK